MKKMRQRSGKRWLSALLVVILLASYCAWALYRPVSPVSAQALSQIQVTAASGSLVWPATGQAAVGIVGSPILEIHGQQTSLPIASTAKLITALAVLQQKPLSLGQQGPTITLTDSDVALYNTYKSQEGSVVQVVAGEQISEYQMLQAILLPSANNVADSLAIWAFGSLKNYAAYANNYATQLGLYNTHIGSDASGFAPDSTSSTRDLVKLGETAMENPVLAQVVGQSTASGLPIVNNVKNVNFLLGTSNIVGIKTGNTDQAGGVFVAASRVTVNNKPVTIVSTVIGAPTLFAAMKDSLNLMRSAQTNFKSTELVAANATVGRYALPWSGTVEAVATNTLQTKAWAGSKVSANTHLQSISSNAPAGKIVGAVTLPKSALNNQQSVTVKLKTAVSEPSVTWRLTHPF